MKRRLAIVLVLALLVTALSGIAIFSSAASTATKDPVRMLVWGFNKYIYNLSTDNTNDSYNYLNGVKQEVPVITVANTGSLSIKGATKLHQGTTKVVDVIINGDYTQANTPTNGYNVPGTKNQPADSRYIGFKVADALASVGADEAKQAQLSTGIKNFLTKYKEAGGQLDGVITDKADSALLDKVVFSAVKEVFPDIAMSAFDVATLNAWDLTGKATSTVAAGNTSSIRWADPVSGYTLTNADKFLGAILRMRDVKNNTNGNFQLILGRTDVMATEYYKDAIAHALLMGGTIIYGEGDAGSYMHTAATTVQYVNSLIGYSDREALTIENASSDGFVISGMYANGRNVYFVTSLNKSNTAVEETEEGVIIATPGQTLTFAGGKLIEAKRDAKNEDGTNKDMGFDGYWVETAADVTPNVVRGYNEAMKETSFMSWDFIVPEHATNSLPYYYGPAWWSATGVTGIMDVFQNNALQLSGTSTATHNYFQATQFFGTHRNDFGVGVDVTLPATALPYGSQIQILRPCNGSSPAQAHYDGIILYNGQLYYNKVDDANKMTMTEDLVPGETYKFKTIYTGALTENPVCDFYVTKTDGTEIAVAKGILVKSCQLGRYWAKLSFAVENIGNDPLIIDNYRLFTVNPDIKSDLSIYDAATGTQITDLTNPLDIAQGFRVTWSNLTKDSLKGYVMAQAYDAEGNPTGDPVRVGEFAMSANSTGVATGSYDPNGASVRLYVCMADQIIGEEFTEHDYGYMPAPSFKMLSGKDFTMKFSTSRDGEYGDWDVANGLGTYFMKVYTEGTVDFAAFESEPIEFQVVKAKNLWDTPLRCPNVPYGQPVIPFAENHFGAPVTYVYSIVKDGNLPTEEYGEYGEYIEKVPTEKGTYWVKATAPAGDLYKASESEPVSFTIGQGVQTMNFVNAPDRFVVFGDEFTLELEGAMGTGALTWAVTAGQNVATVDENGKVTIIGVGDVTITATKAGDEDFDAGSASISFVALKAVADVELPENLTATFGDKLSDIALPEGWAWVDGTMDVGPAGTAGHFAVYTEENHEPVTARLTITVAKAENAWSSDVTIEGWEVGEEANAPAGAAKFGDIVFTYATSENGTYTDTVPTAVGTYWVKAVVAGCSNYNGLETKVQFTIAAATPTEPTEPSEPSEPSNPTEPSEPKPTEPKPTEPANDKGGNSTLTIVLIVVAVVAVAAVVVIFLKKKRV